MHGKGAGGVSGMHENGVESKCASASRTGEERGTEVVGATCMHPERPCPPPLSAPAPPPGRPGVRSRGDVINNYYVCSSKREHAGGAGGGRGRGAPTMKGQMSHSKFNR